MTSGPISSRDVAAASRALRNQLDGLTPERRAYALAALPQVLAATGDVNRLERLVLSFPFLDAKVRELGAEAVLTDLHLLTDREPLNQGIGESQTRAAALAEAVRLASHVLTMDPDELGSQLVGRLRKDAAAASEVAGEIMATARTPWLRPAATAVVPVGGGLERTIVAASGVDGAVLAGDDAVVVAVVSGRVYAWDLATGELVHSIVDVGGDAEEIRHTPANTVFVLASNRGEGVLSEWRLTDGTQVHAVATDDSFRDIAVSGDGQRIAGFGGTGIVVWDAVSLEVQRHITIPELLGSDTGPSGGLIGAGCLDQTGETAYAASWEGALLRIDIADGHVKSVAKSARYGQPIVLASDGSLILAVGTQRHTVLVIDPATGAVRERLRIASEAIYPITALATDGRHVVAGSNDGSVVLWDLATGSAPVVVRGHDSRVNAIAIGRGGRLLSGSTDGTLRLWRMGAVEPSPEGPVAATVGSAAIIDDGETAVTVTPTSVQVWRMADGSPVRTIRGGTGWTRDLYVFPDGRRIATIVSSGDTYAPKARVRILDLRTRRRLREIGQEDYQEFLALAVSPDGTTAVTSFHIDDNQDHVYGVDVWDTATGKRVATEFEERNPYFGRQLAFSHDGQVVLSGDGVRVQVWTPNPIALVSTFHDHEDEVACIAVAKTGLILTGDTGGSILLWSIADGPLGRLSRGRRGSANVIAVAPSGEFAVSGGLDGLVTLWDVSRREPIADYGIDSAVTAVAISVGGDSLLAGDERGSIHILRVERP